ncbi:MAG: DUF177 domain-containing protein [Alphaproteobacteria bacterium]|nr:DUF177 domain-containing protein [Alphaproteobacteria bacterium]
MMVEFTRMIAIEGVIPDKTRTESIEASPEECAVLAERFGLKELWGVKAELTIRRIAGSKTVRVAGAFEAEAIQACVISLQDVPVRIKGQLETFFTDAPKKNAREIDLSPESTADDAEMVENGMIDLGEIVAQYLSLELDPYPRAPGVQLPAQAASSSGGEGKNNPFAVLKQLDESGTG